MKNKNKNKNKNKKSENRLPWEGVKMTEILVASLGISLAIYLVWDLGMVRNPKHLLSFILLQVLNVIWISQIQRKKMNNNKKILVN